LKLYEAHVPWEKGELVSHSLWSPRLEPTLSTQALHAPSNSDRKLSSRSRSMITVQMLVLNPMIN
jgi:hypothetical protein